MIYFLKKTTPSKKGLYLQIYINYYDAQTKTKKTKSFKSLGYVSDLIENGIEDPITYYTNEIKRMNEELKQTQELQISEKSFTKNLGYFLVKTMFDKLGMDNDLNIVATKFNCRYKFSDLFRAIVYAQIISPGSKLKAYERVIPNIYGIDDFTYEQVLDFVNYIGTDYHKYIEVLNHHIAKNWKRNYKKVYFDCTNYYFEIDIEDTFRRKGPSKENRQCPILGQALLLDGDQIPLDTEYYPGNESEKPYLRKRIEEMKSRNNVTGKVIHVADKGLNCARNIYSAVVEAKDGYIFSKSIRGTSIDEDTRRWLIDDKDNDWLSVKDEKGLLAYKYKVEKWRGKHGECKEYGTYKYHCKINPEDVNEKEFEVKEKRIFTYNPKLAAKQKAEILKEVQKLENSLSCRTVLKEELGDMSKFVNIGSIDENGKKVKIVTSIDYDKVNAALDLAGFNLIVTSEIYANPIDIYETYHNLWRIEESFRLLKTYLEARPVFLSRRETIYGHFTICYIALTIMRLLELKTFNDSIPASQLFEFIRNYTITEAPNGVYINNATNELLVSKIKNVLGLSKLGNVYLSKSIIDSFLNVELD